MTPHPRFLKKPNRSADQRRADLFDCDLYGLICIAEKAADEKGPSWGKWQAARMRLIQARLLIRDLMHAHDLKGTD